MKKYCRCPHIDAMVKHLLGQGWSFEHGGKHGRLRSPSGKRLTVPISPSDHRAHLNFKRDIRHVLPSSPTKLSFAA